MRGDKECPFSGVTKSGRVWWRVPESDARSVTGTASYANTVIHKTTPTCGSEETCLGHNVGAGVAAGGDGVVGAAAADVLDAGGAVHCYVLEGGRLAAAELEVIVNGRVGRGAAAVVFSVLTHASCPREDRHTHIYR